MSEPSSESIPTDKMVNRVMRNFVSATAMLGHLCGLYDRGVFEAARLMSNLLVQLAVTKSTNLGLLQQMNLLHIQIPVDVEVLGSRLTPTATMSPLVSLMGGTNINRLGRPVSAAQWIPTAFKPTDMFGFVTLNLEEWLNDPVIPTSKGALSRKDLMLYVRDQDGGAHSDTDERISKSERYVELVNQFPMSKRSGFINQDNPVDVWWDLLPPVSHPILREIAHELLCAIYSATDVLQHFHPGSVFALFNGAFLIETLRPEDAPSPPKIHGRRPRLYRRHQNFDFGPLEFGFTLTPTQR